MHDHHGFKESSFLCYVWGNMALVVAMFLVPLCLFYKLCYFALVEFLSLQIFWGWKQDPRSSQHERFWECSIPQTLTVWRDGIWYNCIKLCTQFSLSRLCAGFFCFTGDKVFVVGEWHNKGKGITRFSQSVAKIALSDQSPPLVLSSLPDPLGML